MVADVVKGVKWVFRNDVDSWIRSWCPTRACIAALDYFQAAHADYVCISHIWSSRAQIYGSISLNAYAWELCKIPESELQNAAATYVAVPQRQWMILHGTVSTVQGRAIWRSLRKCFDDAVVFLEEYQPRGTHTENSEDGADASIEYIQTNPVKQITDRENPINFISHRASKSFTGAPEPIAGNLFDVIGEAHTPFSLMVLLQTFLPPCTFGSNYRSGSQRLCSGHEPED